MLKKHLIKLFLFCFVALLATSCTIEDNAHIDTYNFTVRKSDWVWNSFYGRYECLFNFPELKDDIFEKGAIVGSVYVFEGNSETQKALPFSRTHLYNNISYVETISFDTALGNPNTICFYIQTSDQYYTFLDRYDFKITLISD